MFKFLVNFNHTPDKDWLGDDYIIHDRSDSKEWLKDFPQEKIVYEENVGQVDFPKLMYLADNYDTLPEVFLWGKTNLFQFIEREEYEKVKDNKCFTPLLTKTHKTYSDAVGLMSYYSGGIYHERNNMQYFQTFNYKYFRIYAEFSLAFMLPNPFFVPFAPGGNYILTREAVHRFSRDYYKNMASILPYCQLPLEAQFCERSYYQLWK